MHAGSENRWINGADLVLQSKKTTGDYHDEMTSEHFKEWFHDLLMPNIPANSLDVMDNAPYHSSRLDRTLPYNELQKVNTARLADGTWD